MVNKAGITIIVLLIITLLFTACSTGESSAADYTDIELHMTYSEVVRVLGEPDEIYNTFPGHFYNTKYYVWHFDDGNKLYILLHYPGEYMDDINNPTYPDDYVVYSYFVVNETLFPTTQPTTDPAE